MDVIAGFEKAPTWPSGTAPASEFMDEDLRLKVLANFSAESLDGDSELTRIVQFAAKLFNAPMATVSLVGKEYQHFIARKGITKPQTARSTSFCAHAMLGSTVLEVLDATKDPRFADFSLVTGEEGVRYYVGAPLISREGAPLGALCVTDTKPRTEPMSEFQRDGLEVLALATMQRLSSKRDSTQASKEIARSEERFRLLADSIPDIAWSTDTDGEFDYFNRRWYEFVGSNERPENGWDEYFHPADRDRWFDAWESARALGKPYESEYRLKRGDGSYRWVIARGLPIKAEDGSIERWFGTITDIDDGHRLSESRELIANELAHRIKNIFAVVTGLITLRAQGKEELKAFGEEINATIRALGRAQDFIRPLESDGSEKLDKLLISLMSPYQDQRQDRITITGDSVPICQHVATPLALVFHELATNAAKYGALSTRAGSIAITIEDGANDVAIRWQEKGGPKVAAPQQSGFGTRLTDTAVKNQLGGKISRDWNGDGLQIEITVPVDRLCGTNR